MPSLLIKELIKIAYIRNEEAVSYFKSQAFKCNDKINRSFLLFLTGKKREEQILLEKVALKNNININKFKQSMQGPNRLLINQSDLFLPFSVQ